MTAVAASLKEGLAKRRKELREERTFDLDLPGYSENGLVARYRAVDYATARRINKRHEKVKNEAEQDLNIAGDILTTSCIDLLLRHQDGTLESLGYRLNSQAAADLFDIELPDGVPARDALFAIVPNTLMLMRHFNSEWSEASMEASEGAQEALQGEFEPPTAASSTSPVE